MRTRPSVIAFLYFIVSIVWITGSDQVVHILSSFGGINEAELQTGKGIFFVCVTSVILYLAIRKQQDLLKQSEKQYKGLFYSNPNPLWIYHSETLKFLEVNDSAVRSYGYSRDEFKNMTILDIQPKGDRKKVNEIDRDKADEYNTSRNWTHLKKNGDRIIVCITSNELNFNGEHCVLALAHDVTVKIEQEEMLRLAFTAEKQLKEELENHILLIRRSLEDKQRLAEVVDRINNIVIITDPFGYIIWVNQAFVRFTGYGFEEAIGNKTSFLHGPNTDLKTQAAIMNSLGKKDFSSFEILNYTKSGEEYWVELNISAIYSENREIERYISVQNIITERKERECKILNYNKDLRKLAWTNSHALRKPVASILSLVLLSKDMTHVEEIKETHLLIETCAAELDEITKQIGKEINNREAETLVNRPHKALS